MALCAEADIADPGSRGFVLQIGEAFFHGFVVRKDGQVAGCVDRCPHAGFPLAMELDRYLTPDGSLIMCGWHGAVFEPLSGRMRRRAVRGRPADALAGSGGRRDHPHSLRNATPATVGGPAWGPW